MTSSTITDIKRLTGNPLVKSDPIGGIDTDSIFNNSHSFKLFLTQLAKYICSFLLPFLKLIYCNK